jgi:penicillin amidase
MKKWTLIAGLIIIGSVLVLTGTVYLWFQHAIKKSLPQFSGEVYLDGLKATVKIIRDTYGIPHIYAKNEPDLYFALGYAMAQDRFWQMEFYRRLGQGRLSEVFGEDFTEIDRHFRMLSAAGLNRKVHNSVAFALKSFADGVNTYLKTHRDRLPIEFKLLGYEPHPWGADDYLPIMTLMNWGLSLGWKIDLTAAEILQKVGEAKLREAFPVLPQNAPLIIPKEGINGMAYAYPFFERLRLVNGRIGFLSSPASNNWVVSGAKSVTGKPLLANDTHLGLTNPSVWWEAHLVCPTINVSGFAIPGAPGFAVGHNFHVAWGVTNVMVDDVDFYIEKINPENSRQYWYENHWEDMTSITETIRIKGIDPIKTEILLTRHGPILPSSQKSSKKSISFKWAFNEALQPALASYLLSKAKDIYEVKEALKYWEAPSQNFVFADTKGNIGYWCGASIPIRSKGDGLLPVPGWTGEYEWKGYVPFDKRPHAINPEAGFIATANNKVIADDYPYYIGNYWEPMDRIFRIRYLLAAKQKLSINDFKHMHQDVYCLLASEMGPKMIQVLQDRFSDNKARQAKEILSKWDFMMTKNSVGACIFEMTYQKMMANIFGDELGEDLLAKYLETTLFPPRAIRVMLKKGRSPWFDDVNTLKEENMADIIEKSLRQTFRQLSEMIGNDVAEWTWGHIHTLTFEHVFAKKKPLDRIFNIGPFAVGGSHLTINKRQYAYAHPYHANLGASQRMIVDLDNVGHAFHVLPTGESGQLGSRHYNDQINLYLNGQYHPVWTDRQALEKHRQGTLTLRPKTSEPE